MGSEETTEVLRARCGDIGLYVVGEKTGSTPWMLESECARASSRQNVDQTPSVPVSRSLAFKQHHLESALTGQGRTSAQNLARLGLTSKAAEHPGLTPYPQPSTPHDCAVFPAIRAVCVISLEVWRGINHLGLEVLSRA